MLVTNNLQLIASQASKIEKMASSATQVFFFFVMLTNIVEVVLLNVLCKVVQLYYFLFMGAQMFAGVGLVFDVKCAHASTYKYSTHKKITPTRHITPPCSLDLDC